MSSTPNRASNPPGKPRRKDVNLDLPTARQMLPLIRSIVADIKTSRQAIEQLTPEQERLDRHRRDLVWLERQCRYQVSDEIAAAEKSLTTALGELSGLGVSLLDAEKGEVDFPTKINGRRFHVGHHLASGWLHLSASAAVAHDGLAAIPHHHNRERNGDEIGGQSGFRHRALDVVHRGIGDEGGIVRFFPDAVIERGDVSPADFVSHKSFCGVRRLLRKGRRYREPAIEAKRDRKAGGNDEVASRQVEHDPSPSRNPITDAGAHCADGIRTWHPRGLFPPELPICAMTTRCGAAKAVRVGGLPTR